LTSHILVACENRYAITKKSTLIPERVKEVRRTIIAAREEHGESASQDQHRQWAADMDNMFLVTQLYSYPGNYLLENPSIERIAETLDKLEEDALEATYPTVHGQREVIVQFATPIELPMGKEKRLSPADLTDEMELRVQSMLDELNAARLQKSK
jgi:hypothetical protein